MYTTSNGKYLPISASSKAIWEIRGIKLNKTIDVLLEFGDEEVDWCHRVIARSQFCGGIYRFSRFFGFTYG